MKTYRNQNGSRVAILDETKDGRINWAFLNKEGQPIEIMTTSPEGMAKCLKENGYKQEGATAWKQD